MTKDVADELQDLREKTNPLIERAEAAIKGLRLASAASVQLTKDKKLFYGKRGGEWRLFVTRDDAQFHLLVNESFETRLAALRALPSLVEALRDAASVSLEEMVAVISRARLFLDELEGRSRA